MTLAFTDVLVNRLQLARVVETCWRRVFARPAFGFPGILRLSLYFSAGCKASPWLGVRQRMVEACSNKLEPNGMAAPRLWLRRNGDRDHRWEYCLAAALSPHEQVEYRLVSWALARWPMERPQSSGET